MRLQSRGRGAAALELEQVFGDRPAVVLLAQAIGLTGMRTSSKKTLVDLVLAGQS